MANKICKIVYFDEDSITDYVQIVAGGSLETTTELLKSSEVRPSMGIPIQRIRVAAYCRVSTDGDEQLGSFVS